VIGATYAGPAFNEWPYALITIGTQTRLVLRNDGAAFPNVNPNDIAYAALSYDGNFSAIATATTATVEANHRSVQKDWRVALNKSASWFLLVYRQQDHLNQSLGVYGGVERFTSPDTGLYASRLTTVKTGGTPSALSGLALAGSSAVRLDADSSTTSPLDPNQYRDEAVAFAIQSEMQPLTGVQSHLDRIGVLFVKVDDGNPAWNDARNTPLGGHSFDGLKIIQVENGASALTLRPAQGGATVADLPFNYLTQGNQGLELDEELDEGLASRAAALDAGLSGALMVYFMKPTTAEAQVSGIYQLPTPSNVRLFATNFDGSSATLPTPKLISSSGGDGEKQVLGFLSPLTRGISTAAVNGLYHYVLLIEDRSWASGFLGGGALVSVRYNKAVPERGDTAVPSVTDAAAFTPALTLGPTQADFKAGDSISFPVGYGMGDAGIALYFIQFGEIYYTENAAETGSWWKDDLGLPAPTLLSHEGFPGMPNSFVQEAILGGTDFFGAQAFGNTRLERFTGLVGTTSVDCMRWNNLNKALAFYAKDDGGWDPENDGTGFHRLFCRIRD